MNQLSQQLTCGTIGELLVQLRLLQYDVQAVSPHKDSGNDLLALRGECFRAIQVKTTKTEGPFSFSHTDIMGKHFHILALVRLVGDGRDIALDNSAVYLLARNEVTKGHFEDSELAPFEVSAPRIDALFPTPVAA